MRRWLVLGALVAASCGPQIDEAALRAEIRAEILEEQRRDNAARRENAERQAPPVGPLPEDDAVRLRVGAEDAPRRGADAPLVTIVTFSDFQCPFCSRVVPTLDRLLREYPDEVALVFRNNPLSFHQQAMPAAEAAREVWRQGGDAAFWRYHDVLFANQQALGRADLLRYAVQVGVDPAEVERALDDHRHREAIAADQRETGERGARGTPAFFINGVQLMGAQPYDRFRDVVDAEIRHARALMEHGVSRRQLYGHLMEDARTEPPDAPDRPAPTARRRPDPDAVYRVPTGDRPQLGPDDALVTIVAFTDFQCPFCNRARATLEQIRQRYGTDVRLVIRHNPLAFHTDAEPAAEAAMEVHAQLGDRGFFRYHDLLFENQRDLDRETLLRLAAQAGANPRQVEAALEDHRHRSAIQEDRVLANRLGATGTPSFFVNGRFVRGAQPLSAFEPVIDDGVARARALIQGGTPRGDLYERLIRDGHETIQYIGDAPDAAPSARPREDPDRVYAIAVPPRAPTRGPASAPVTIQVFSDFQCPFCNRARPTLDQIVQRYGPRVRIVWRDYPLPFHQQAMPAAEAAREVFRQRGDRAFWAFHDLLFDNQRSLSEDEIVRLAGQVRGVNERLVRRALSDHRHRDAVQADMRAIQEAGARIGTPSFFINGRLVQGAQPFPAFEAAIDRALAEAANP